MSEPVWHYDVPPTEASGNIYAWAAPLFGMIVNLYHYSDGTSRWGYGTKDETGHWRTRNIDILQWRWINGEIPSLEQQGQAMLVWYWKDAPGELRALSDHGGDEDFISLLPLNKEAPSWMDDGSSFGHCRVSSYRLPDGREVRIGAHA